MSTDALRIRTLRPRELGRFLDFAASLYEGDPLWVPPLRLWERRRLAAAMADPDRLTLFVAERGRGWVGTASIRRDETFARDPDEKVAWFGYFECREDEVAAAALLNACAQVAGEWGADVIRGPRNLSRFEFVGLAVEGHDTLPPLLQSHHPRYYQRLVEGAGLVKHHDVYAYDTPLVEPDGRPRALPEKLSRKAEGCAIDGLRFRRASRRRLERDLGAAHEVLNEAYQTVPDVSPMPRGTFMALGRALAIAADPELIQLAFVGDRAVGFAICLPEINEALVRCRGRLLPAGWLKLLAGWRGIHTAAFKLIGVVPDLRGTGLHSAMIRQIVLGAQRAGYTRMDGSVIDERNGPMRGVVEGLGMEIYRVYRFYQRSI